MFLTILEDGGKINRLRCELAMRTRQVKQPVGEKVLPQLDSCDFKSLPSRLINRHRESNFLVKLESLEFKGYIVGQYHNITESRNYRFLPYPIYIYIF